MKLTRLLLTAALSLLGIGHAAAERVDMRAAGAAADGQTLNTALINATIDRLAAAGGGTLYFPAGTYLTGAVKLKSNITIEIEAGATLRFSDNFDDYLPYVEMRFEGVVMKSFCPLFYAYEAENITITGRGTIDGQGRKWWEAHNAAIALAYGGKSDLDIERYRRMWREQNDEAALLADTNEDYIYTIKRHFFRPAFIQPYRCTNVRVEGITIINSPFWTVNPEFCDNVTVTGVTINNPHSPNTDGINPESCRNVHISDCHISVGDDCITIKSGRDRQARELARPCENITVTNCTMLSGHGGVVIGSEMSGSVRKVTISNCVFDGTDRGIRIKSTRGRGGSVEEIRVNNIVMKHIPKEAIVLNLYYSKMPEEPLSERTPCFRNIHITGMTGSEVNQAALLLGIEEQYIENISFDNINIDAKRGFEASRVRDIDLTNIRITTSEGPAFRFTDGERLYLNNLRNNRPIASAPLIELKDCRDVCITGCFPKAGSKTFVEQQGCSGIRSVNNIEP